MRNKFNAIILVILASMLVSCGKEKVSQAYSDFLSEAKIQIVNEDYHNAKKFLSLANDEKQGDETVAELNYQIDLVYKLNDAIENVSQFTTEARDELGKEISEFHKKKLNSNLLADKITELYTEFITMYDNTVGNKNALAEFDYKLGDAIHNRNYEEAAEYADLIVAVTSDMGVDNLEYNEVMIRERAQRQLELARYREVLASHKEGDPKKFEDYYNHMKAEIEKTGEVIDEQLRLGSSDSDNYYTVIVQAADYTIYEFLMTTYFPDEYIKYNTNTGEQTVFEITN